jgi:uncharacterized protein YjiS (DUF1127 family)
MRSAARTDEVRLERRVETSVQHSTRVVARWPDRFRITHGIRRLIFGLDLVLDVRCERRMLLRMDDRALKDIGLSRSEAYAEARRSLWDIPRERLLL